MKPKSPLSENNALANAQITTKNLSIWFKAKKQKRLRKNFQRKLFIFFIYKETVKMVTVLRTVFLCIWR